MNKNSGHVGERHRFAQHSALISHISYERTTTLAGSASKFRNSNRTVRTVSRVRPITVVVRRAAVVAVCLVMSLVMAPSTHADPDADPDAELAAAAAPPADGGVPSA